VALFSVSAAGYLHAQQSFHFLSIKLSTQNLVYKLEEFLKREDGQKNIREHLKLKETK
jgi:hypothetical protein